MEDAYFMRQALLEAEKAYALGEVPVGAIIVAGDRILARGHNLTEQLNDVTAHAEMQAFTAAAEALGGKYLEDCTLYVTLEPCVMCAGAAYWTQISRIIYATSDEKRGFSLLTDQLLHPKTKIERGLLANEAADLLTRFFKEKRNNH